MERRDRMHNSKEFKAIKRKNNRFLVISLLIVNLMQLSANIALNDIHSKDFKAFNQVVSTNKDLNFELQQYRKLTEYNNILKAGIPDLKDIKD